MRNLESFLAKLPPMQAARARAALETKIRLNGGLSWQRHHIIQSRVNAGALVGIHRGERVLMNPDGSFLDTKNATKIGIDYAEFLMS